MLHQILVDLRHRGHEVAVITENPGSDRYEGVELYESSNDDLVKSLIKSCDIIITHLILTKVAIGLGEKYQKPVVHLLHNDFDIKDQGLVESATENPSLAALVIANSNWVKETVDPILPTIVVNPPTKIDRYRVKTDRKFVTLVNMSSEKGGNIFWQLAKSMPDLKFLGVKGGWGDQVLEEGLPNVTVIENRTDIQSVYAKTKIIIMPSLHESWGRVGIEASCSGIPVIAAPTDGLKESLADVGIFADRENLDEWIAAIRSLEDVEVYNKYSKATQERAEYLDQEFDKQMNVLEEHLLKIRLDTTPAT